MPRLTAMGLAPAVMFFIPALTIAAARAVAVVVPSPATSLVLSAACLTNCAPMLAKGSDNSISFATETPSWMTAGAPHFLSMATLRPLGPKVVTTALVRMLTPKTRLWRASSENLSCLALMRLQREYLQILQINIPYCQF